MYRGLLFFSFALVYWQGFDKNLYPQVLLRAYPSGS